VTSTSTFVAVRSRTRTRSPQASSVRGEPSSRRNMAKSTLIAKSSATADPPLPDPDRAHRRPDEADADGRDALNDDLSVGAAGRPLILDGAMATQRPRLSQLLEESRFEAAGMAHIAPFVESAGA
jgi:hypothetical protein